MGLEILVLLLASWIAKHWRDNNPPPRGSGRAPQPPVRRTPPARRPPTIKPLPSAPEKPSPVPVPAPAQAQKNKTTPPPWPQAMPVGLPAWPAGWTPATPPPAAVVTRAWQLLPTLWKTGAGTKATEQTGGSWYTYVASWMNPAKTTKGVVAFKPKEGIIPAIRQPSGSV